MSAYLKAGFIRSCLTSLALKLIPIKGGRLRPLHRLIPTWFENVLPGMKAEKKLHIPFEDAVRYYFL